MLVLTAVTSLLVIMLIVFLARERAPRRKYSAVPPRACPSQDLAVLPVRRIAS
jgi:hypothetical protein